MGYTTEFCGQLNLNRPLTSEHRAYLDAFSTGAEEAERE